MGRSLVAGIAAALIGVPIAAAQPLRTAFLDPTAFGGTGAPSALERAREAGASAVRLALFWPPVAPTAPAGNRADPANPGYSWAWFDQQVRDSVAAGLDPIVYISGSPKWARERGIGSRDTWPRPTELARFAEAAARRYSGRGTLPRVRYWQVWNEPNARRDLSPQFRNGRPVSPAHYRKMVNAFAQAVYRVHADNRIVAGGLGPFGHFSRDIQVVAPLRFMSELLCVARKPPHRRTCRDRTRLDIWSHNPYTNGGPSRSARAPDDVSIGDLPEMRRMLDAARRAGTIVSRQRPEFWVTEFSWDTRPSDPKGVPMALHARWVAEAFYRMWRAGVSLVTWFRIRDDPLRATPYQSGVFFANGDPKLSLTAFRFPFVAFAERGGVTVWGRTPNGRPGDVIVESTVGSGWREAARIRTDGFGTFSRRLSGPLRGSLRARLPDGATSVPFSLTRPRDRNVSPFGCGGAIRC